MSNIIFDNRNYFYSEKKSESFRKEYPYIVDWVGLNSKVIDLGCGDGSLLALLKREKNIIEKGFDISESGVKICKIKGLDVEQRKIDILFDNIPNDFYDFSICNVTIQMVMYPEALLREMKRIARYQIISFPNFAYITNRIDMFFRGKMPSPMMFGYKWYNTDHIHQFSIKDFTEFIDKNGLKIEKRKFLGNNKFLREKFPNLFCNIALFLLTKID